MSAHVCARGRMCVVVGAAISSGPEHINPASRRIQWRASRIDNDPVVFGPLEPLALRRDVTSLCMLYSIYHREFCDGLFNPISVSEFRHRSLAGNTIITVTMRDVLPRTHHTRFSATYSVAWEWSTVNSCPM
ncbi:hypothetical protein EVAR_63467_1 [Eumeta japonica]|uniref:Uncharacterized protein n=1 Tax=Eumeta variegata TaxID=151549 RepID=A0A4C1YA44_EUMVA|nr:hypothetical protein EVAR_63467_1 [Eumeta japonica]